MNAFVIFFYIKKTAVVFHEQRKMNKRLNPKFKNLVSQTLVNICSVSYQQSHGLS